VATRASWLLVSALACRKNLQLFTDAKMAITCSSVRVAGVASSALRSGASRIVSSVKCHDEESCEPLCADEAEDEEEASDDAIKRQPPGIAVTATTTNG